MTEKSSKSKAEQLAALTAEVDALDLEELDKAVLFRMMAWHRVVARPNQLQPEEWNIKGSTGGPDVWFLLGGRGGGKTRTGSETTGSWAMTFPKTRWCCLSPTLKDARSVMFEGDSGLLNVVPEAAMLGGSIDKAWKVSNLELHLRNGSLLAGYSSEKPGRLRGPSFTVHG